MHIDNIVKKIQSDILRPEVKLSSILLAAKVLAHQLNNAEFVSWVNSELDGYRLSDEVPEYRMFTPPSKGIFSNGYTIIIRNKIIPVLLIRDEWLKEQVTQFPISHGIRSMEELASKPNEELNSPWADELVQLFNHQNILNMPCVEASFVLNAHQFAQILDTVRGRLLDFVLELGSLDWKIEQDLLPNEQIKHLVEVKIFNSPQGDKMSVFDQRGQNVNYQYNAAGDINIEAVQNSADLIEELGKLKTEIEKAQIAGIINEDDAIDAEYQVQKAIQAAKKSKPDKTSFMEHIERAKGLLEGATAATDLVNALLKIVDIATDLF